MNKRDILALSAGAVLLVAVTAGASAYVMNMDAPPVINEMRHPVNNVATRHLLKHSSPPAMMIISSEKWSAALPAVWSVMKSETATAAQQPPLAAL